MLVSLTRPRSAHRLARACHFGLTKGVHVRAFSGVIFTCSSRDCFIVCHHPLFASGRQASAGQKLTGGKTNKPADLTGCGWSANRDAYLPVLPY